MLSFHNNSSFMCAVAFPIFELYLQPTCIVYHGNISHYEKFHCLFCLLAYLNLTIIVQQLFYRIVMPPCSDETNPCAPDANCGLLDGDITCTCAPGFTGNGFEECSGECLHLITMA